jgi:hypothetical protein
MPTVYKLINPLTEQIYYVGYTTKHITVRLMGHLAINKQLPTTQLLQKKNILPIIQVIEEGDGVTMQTENYWIKKLKDEGHKLENTGPGPQPAIFEIRREPKYNGDNKLKMALQSILDELPLGSSIPIVQRIKNIAENALSL